MAKKKTLKQFIDDANIVHNFKYDYSKTVYINSSTKIEIACNSHGSFFQTPSCHLQGDGCFKCGVESRNKIRMKSNQEFINEANIIHNFNYDYSEVKYNGSKRNVKILCKIHGYFLQTPNSHLKGQGCKECGIESRTKLQTKSLQDFVNESNKIHNFKYDYSKAIYVTAHTKIKILCKLHGYFLQAPNSHLKGQGCKECGIESRAKIQTKLSQDFVNESNKIHNFKYDYSKSKYEHGKSKVIIGCNDHGEFLQRPNDHLNGIGCPICSESKGEKIVAQWLDQNNILYQRQKTFEECKNKTHLKFDFYLIDYNLCIEYDGEQHFHAVDHFGGQKSFSNRVKNDQIKNKFCQANNINLLRISYQDFNDIGEILNTKIGDV